MLRSCGLALAMLGAVALGTPAQAEDETIYLELNKASPNASGDGCILTFLMRNGLEQRVTDLVVQLAILDRDGIHVSNVSVPGLTVEPNRRRIQQFTLGRACGEISEFFVNDITSCSLGDSTSEAGEADGTCVSALSVASRAEILFGL